MSAKGVLLEQLTWTEAEMLLSEDSVVVLPIGAASKEHGPHLKLSTDFLLAEYLKHRIVSALPVVVAPTIGYFYYPAFKEYPGSVTLRLTTSRDTICDIAKSLNRFGPKKFYVLNTGVSTIRALNLASEELTKKNILLRYSDIVELMAPVVARIQEQDGGTHADEIETSIMLFIAPETVDMSRAVRDYHPSSGHTLTRNPRKQGIYSPTGVWGDATLASRKKGKLIVEAIVGAIVQEIDRLLLSATPP